MPGSPHGRPVIFGEVLYDRFPDGAEVVGGAPFNVAWHLAGFGLAPLFISRIGDDPAGGAVLGAMRAWNMDTGGVQLDAGHATGLVHVTLTHGQPAFDIVADQAYDHIDQRQALKAVSRCAASILYHGSLAARSSVSREALCALRRGGRPPVFVDVNLRPPWWNAGDLEAIVRGARWVKLNEAELSELRPAGPPACGDAVFDARALMTRFGAQTVIVTRGADGAEVVTANEVLRGSPVPVRDLLDTVGAGDAFSAVFVAGILSGWSAATTLERALGFAAAVCAIRGATTTDRGLYARHREAWGLSESP